MNAVVIHVAVSSVDPTPLCGGTQDTVEGWATARLCPACLKLALR